MLIDSINISRSFKRKEKQTPAKLFNGGMLDEKQNTTGTNFER